MTDLDLFQLCISSVMLGLTLGMILPKNPVGKLWFLFPLAMFLFVLNIFLGGGLDSLHGTITASQFLVIGLLTLFFHRRWRSPDD